MRSVAAEVEAQGVPKVTLELAIVDVIYNGEAEVIVGVSQTETLMALGWTPPDEAQRPALTHRRALE